jgi:hypothetical protein
MVIEITAYQTRNILPIRVLHSSPAALPEWRGFPFTFIHERRIMGLLRSPFAGSHINPASESRVKALRSYPRAPRRPLWVICALPREYAPIVGAGTILLAARFARIPTREDGGARPHPFDNLGALPGPVRHGSDPVLGEKEAPGHLGSGLVALRGPR